VFIGGPDGVDTGIGAVGGRGLGDAAVDLDGAASDARRTCLR
jgi:hypothetical protein